MPLIDNAINHFNSIQRKTVEIDVPEWGCTIYAKPMNMMQKSEVVALYTENELGKAVATKLYHMARDESGARLFSRDDINGLMTKADPKVMQRIASKMEVDPDLETIEKN